MSAEPNTTRSTPQSACSEAPSPIARATSYARRVRPSSDAMRRSSSVVFSRCAESLTRRRARVCQVFETGSKITSPESAAARTSSTRRPGTLLLRARRLTSMSSVASPRRLRTMERASAGASGPSSTSRSGGHQGVSQSGPTIASTAARPAVIDVMSTSRRCASRASMSSQRGRSSETPRKTSSIAVTATASPA